MSPAEQNQLDRGFRLLDARLDDVRALNASQHTENVGRFGRIESELSDIKETVAAYGEQLKSLFEKMKAIEGRPTAMDLSSFRWYIACFLGGVFTVTVSVSALAWVLHVLKVI